MKRFILLIISIIFVNSVSADVCNHPCPGKLIFEPIKKLPENWWENPKLVWEIWDENTYYIWGANLNNFNIFCPQEMLKGSGMASVKFGPTHGRGHPHYVGVITTALCNAQNDEIFSFLEQKLKEGANIVIPVIDGRYALGTGVAFRRHETLLAWYQSQKYLFEKIVALSAIAREIELKTDPFWPDCGHSMSSDSPIKLAIRSSTDLHGIIFYIDTKMFLIDHFARTASKSVN